MSTLNGSLVRLIFTVAHLSSKLLTRHIVIVVSEECKRTLIQSPVSVIVTTAGRGVHLRHILSEDSKDGPPTMRHDHLKI